MVMAISPISTLLGRLCWLRAEASLRQMAGTI